MQIYNLVALYVTYCYSSSLVACTPVPQDPMFPPTSSSESNMRKAYLSRQFEDHTKNFILRAQERFELQAEKRKQQAKTKKAYSSINQLPVSSTNTNGKSVAESVELLRAAPAALWFLGSREAARPLDTRSHIKLTRHKRQDAQSTVPSAGVNLDAVLDFVKEQTAKLEQVNRQLKSLTNSVSQGLDKLRESTSSVNGSLVDSLQASAVQMSRDFTKTLDTFNPTTSTTNSSPSSMSSLNQAAGSALSNIQAAFATVSGKLSPSSDSQTTGQASDSLTSILQG